LDVSWVGHITILLDAPMVHVSFRAIGISASPTVGYWDIYFSEVSYDLQKRKGLPAFK